MTPEEERLLRRVAVRYMTEALAQTIDFVGQPDEVVREALYPHWREAVHRIMVKVGACECENDPNGCILDMEKDELLALFRKDHPLSFDELVRAFRLGEQMALGQLITEANEQGTC